MRRILAVLLMTGCASQSPALPQVPKLQAWEDRAAEVSQLPAEHPKTAWSPGTILSVEKDDPAPFPGILLTEERAMDAGKLRIAYDELNSVCRMNQRLYVATAKVADGALQKSDAENKRLAEDLRKAREKTWWDTWGTTVSFAAGVIGTGLFTVGVLAATKDSRGVE